VRRLALAMTYRRVLRAVINWSRRPARLFTRPGAVPAGAASRPVLSALL